MNALERIVYTAGRLRGLYHSAIEKANAPATDPTAWLGGPYWGPGALAMSRKPGSSADIAQWFTSWAYICAVTNANARAAVATELYTEAAPGGEKWQTVRTRRIGKATRKHIERQANLRRWLRKADDIEEITEHPYLDLMARPNPFLSEADLKYLTSIFMDLTGGAYWYIGVKDALGAPAQIWPLPSQYIRPIPGKTLKDFIAGYEYIRGSVRQTLAVDDVVEFRVPNPTNDYMGMACLCGVADAVFSNAKMYEFEHSVFEQKARIGGMLETETRMSKAEADRLREEFKQKYSGAAQAGKTIVLPPGMKFTRDYVTPEELSFIEGKRITSEEICIGFGVPKALFDPNAIRANVEGAQYTHAKYSIQPWLTRYDDTINGDFLPIYDEKIFVCSDNPVREDKTYLLQKRTADIAAGIATINEERAEDGKEPIEGGDEPLISSLLAPLSQVVEVPEPKPAPVIIPPATPKPDEEPEEGGNIDTGEEATAGKVMRLVLEKIKARLGTLP